MPQDKMFFVEVTESFVIVQDQESGSHELSHSHWMTVSIIRASTMSNIACFAVLILRVFANKKSENALAVSILIK